MLCGRYEVREEINNSKVCSRVRSLVRVRERGSYCSDWLSFSKRNVVDAEALLIRKRLLISGAGRINVGTFDE